MPKDKTLNLFGIKWNIMLIILIVGYVGMITQTLKTDIPSTLFLMFVLGIPFYEIGNRIPIWNKYVGGGIVLTFLVTPLLVYFNLIPEIYVEAIHDFTLKSNFLTLFIIVLITGSILSLNSKFLIKSFVGYIPAILGGLVGASLLGILIGLLFDIQPQQIIVNYVLPIMGGGNGGGAVPLAQMYEDITGFSKDTYYQFSIIILTIANVFAIICASLLDVLGRKKPHLTGDKKRIIRNDHHENDSIPDPTSASLSDVGGGLILALAVYALGMLMGNLILPTVLGVKIHSLAYTIIFVVIITAFDLVPENLKEGAKELQSFFVKYFTVVIMVGVGIELDLGELIGALTLANMLISLAIVIGSILGSGFIGYVFGFYPIDIAVTAGLCMANRGGSGDLAVLGAADRMGLMAYAQLSSRLGGALVLIIGSILFTILF